MAILAKHLAAACLIAVVATMADHGFARELTPADVNAADFSTAHQRKSRAVLIKMPVGSVWMNLNARTYGIHGTAEPEKIGKISSHGCVRLTNWDAKALAAMVKKGTTVAFQE